jgi:hypothetical protein
MMRAPVWVPGDGGGTPHPALMVACWELRGAYGGFAVRRAATGVQRNFGYKPVASFVLSRSGYAGIEDEREAFGAPSATQ